MELLYENIPTRQDHSFHTHRAVHPYLYTPWHHHEELELIYVHRGSGTRYVGNHVARFEPGEVVLIGSGVPHVWKNDDEYYEENSGLEAEVWVIHFPEQFWGEEFSRLPEMRHVNGMLANAQRGIAFEFTEDRDQFLERFTKLLQAESIDRVHLLLEMFGILAEKTNRRYLNARMNKNPSELESDRLQKVYTYVTDNFLEEISLEEAADAAGLSATGFCRFFKRYNNKTFINYVNEVRVEHACHLLREKDIAVTEVCYASGFNNFSNFSRRFNSFTGLSPRQYRERFSAIKR